ncbi:hypothetical protein [Clostridium sp. BJN0013]|uniref:hypothetical protein n=1 Tax=Clostridium sp. BJN0013 TaxID=3236840 RepID=UPI0034C66E16
MLQLSKNNKKKVLESIKCGSIDAADVNFPNLIDTITLKMKKINLIDKLSNSFKDKRSKNKKLPLDILIALAVTVKMKLKTSLTDVVFAVTDSELLSELGWNIWDTDRDMNKGLFSEGVIRNFVSKYSGKSLPAVIKNYKSDKQKSVIIYSGQYFGVFSFIEFIQLYAGCPAEVRKLLDPTLALV